MRHYLTWQAERDRSVQLDQTDLLRNHVSDIESQLNKQRMESNSARDEAVQQKATSTQMRFVRCRPPTHSETEVVI